MRTRVISSVFLVTLSVNCGSTSVDYSLNRPQPVVSTSQAPANTEIRFAEPTPNKHDADREIYEISPTPDPDDPDKVYIPKDLDDCFVELSRMLHPSFVEKLKTADETPTDQHFGLGLWMRNNWRLWGDGRLIDYFYRIGIFHPDDMSAIILQSYVRHLKDEPLRLEEQVKYYQAYWKKQTSSDREKLQRYTVKGDKDSSR